MKKVHFIDCGANIGNAIDWAIEKYKERLIKIDAFEPEYKKIFPNQVALINNKLTSSLGRK